MSKKAKNPNIALINFVRTVSAHLANAEKNFPTQAPPMTAEAKKHTVKARKGGERIVGEIANLVKSHDLDSGALDSTTMTTRLEAGTTLAPLIAQLTKIQQQASDQQYAAMSDAWGMALQFYALLQRRATTDTTLAANLEPIAAFFAYRHELVENAKPTKLQTRAAAKLRKAQKLNARAKPRASVLEQEADAAAAAASHPAPTVTVSPTPSSSVSIITTAPVASPAPVPAVNVVTNGASNGALNGASNGVAAQ